MKTKKHLGQHWLKNRKVCLFIAHYQELDERDLVIEIGPGLGALTKHLLTKCNHIFLIEKDPDLISRLEHNLRASTGRFTIINQDILEFDYNSIAQNRARSLVIYGNLPYNIGTRILNKMIPFKHLIKSITVLLQREVVQRIIALPGKNHARLSIMMQLHFIGQSILNVPNTDFNPIPKVQSEVMYMTVRNDHMITSILSLTTFEHVVSQAFNQRRKKIRNSLANLNLVGLDQYLDRRPQDLSLTDFITIANTIEKHRTILI